MEKIEILFDANRKYVSVSKILKDEVTKPTKVKKGCFSLTQEIVELAEVDTIKLSETKQKRLLKAYADAEKENERLKAEWTAEHPNWHWMHNPYYDGHKKMDMLKRNLEKIFKGFYSNEYCFYGGGALSVYLVK